MKSPIVDEILEQRAAALSAGDSPTKLLIGSEMLVILSVELSHTNFTQERLYGLDVKIVSDPWDLAVV